MSRFLRVFAIFFGLIFAGNAFAAGYTCDSLKTYTSCNAGYFMSGTTCTKCGTYSSTDANNTSTSCTCNDGYTTDGAPAGSSNTTTTTAACTAIATTITLNGNGATTAGTTAIYGRYNTQMLFLDSAFSQAMASGSGNAITAPSRVHTVTFNRNGGAVTPSSATATYTFNGYWSASSGGTQYIGTSGYPTSAGYSAGAALKANATWYAQWTGGSVTLPTPTKAGYVFNGWYTAASGGTKVGAAGASYTPTSNITLYAQWLQCEAGYYCPAGSTSVKQNGCGAGKYSAAASKSSSDCKAIDAGCYGTSASSSCPAVCGANQYSNAGASSCTGCPTDYENSGTSASSHAGSASCIITVSAGKYIGTAGDNSTNWDTCAGGTYKASHTVAYGSTSSCSTCSAGYYCPEGAGSQIECGSNNKYSSSGAASCSTVTSGYYSTGGTETTRTGQSQCTGATYCTSGVKYDCPSGYTADTSNGKTAATQCDISVTGGKYIGTAGDNSSNWDTCACGTYKAAHTVAYGSTSSCAKTDAGYYAAAGASSQTKADAGYYAAAGACSQSACAAPYSSSAAGSDDTNDCYLTTSATKYVAEAGKGEVTCAAGGYCPGGSTIYRGGTVTGRATTGGRTACGAGTKNANTGSSASSACTSCAAGTYSTGGASSCSTITDGCYGGAGSVKACPNSCSALNAFYTKSDSGRDTNADCYGTTAATKYVAEAGKGQVACTGGYCPGGTKVYYATGNGSTTGGRNTLSNWTCPDSSDAAADCYRGVTLNKNNMSGTLALPSSSGCRSIGGATGTTADTVYVYYGVACKLPTTALSGSATGTTYTGTTTWATSANAASGFVSSITLTDTSSTTPVRYAGKKYTCSGGYYLKASTNGACTACPDASYCLGISDKYYSTSTQGLSACSALDSTKTDGTYSSVSPRSANTHCRFTQNQQTVPTYCQTKTSNTMSYGGTAWPTSTYSVTAKAGSIISGNNTATATCSQCSGAVFSGGGTATSCTACPAQTSGWSRGTGTGWDSYADCYQTKAATSVSSYCESGQLKQIGASATTWATATVSTTFKADAGAYVTGSGASTSCSQCTANYYCPGGTTTRQACSSLSGVSVSGGSYTSAAGSDASTDCKYTAPAPEVPTYCATKTSNTVTYSGTAWPTSTYSVTAKAGSIISGNNTATATCSQCTGATYSAGGTATTCSSCDSNYQANTTAGKSLATQCQISCGAGQAVLEKNAACAIVTGNNYKTGTALVNYGSTSPTASDKTSGWAADTIYACPSSYSISGTATTNHDARTDCTISCAKGTQVVSANVACTTPSGTTWYTAAHSVSAGSTSGSNVKSCNTGYATANTTTVTDHDEAADCKIGCSAGYYIPTAGEGCKVCTAGKYCSAISGIAQTSTSAVTGNVTAGYWNNGCGTNATGSVCSTSYSGGTIAAGYYGGAGATSSTGSGTVSGGYYSTGGGTSATPTSAGTGCLSSFKCGKLSAAYYSNGGSTADGATCVSGKTCGTCDSNYRANTATGKTAVTQCETQCAAGTAVLTANNACATIQNSTYKGKYTAQHNVAYGSKSDISTCPTYYQDGNGAAGQANCINSCAAGTQVASANADCTTPNTTNWYTDVHNVTYGKTSANLSKVIACDSDYANSGTTAANHAGVTSCKVTCAAGTYVASSGAACTDVDSGYYRSGTETVSQTKTGTRNACTALGAIYKASDSGRDASTDCYATTTAKSYVKTAKDATETSCPAGSYCPGSVKVYYNSTGGSTPCPAGKFCVAGVSAGTECVLGSYSAAGASACTACQDGKTTSAKGATSCNATCSNATGVSDWETASWATTNTMTNLCTIAATAGCSANYYKNSNACSTCSSGTNSKYTLSAAGTTSVNSCYLKTTEGKYVATKGAGETACISPYYCPGGTTIYYGTGTTTGGNSTCTGLGAIYKASDAGASKNTQCYATTSAGKYVTAKATSEAACPAGDWCAGSVKVYYGSAGGNTDCPSGYTSGTTGYSAQSQCLMSVAGGKYVATEKESSASGTCAAGYYKPAHTVNYGGTSSCSACTGATYQPSTGQASCLSCPAATNDTANVSSYGYWNGGSTGDHTVRSGCNVTFKSKTLDDGVMTSYACYVDTGADTYGVDGTSRSCLVNRNALTCNGGYYNSTFNNSSTATQYTSNKTLTDLYANVCQAVGTGYYSANDALTRTACSTGLVTCGSGACANEADDCGRKLHMGANTIYLRSAKRGTPALNVKIGDKTFYGVLSTSLSSKAKVKNGTTTYSVVNDNQ